MCAKACPIDAIEMIDDPDPDTKRKKLPKIDNEFCLGCGVCASKCKPKSMTLVSRKQRVILPENSFERVILASLERGVLQYQLFDNPSNIGHKFMRGFLGGFLRLPPVKKALMSDMLRSRFLGSIRIGAKLQGRGWLKDF